MFLRRGLKQLMKPPRSDSADSWPGWLLAPAVALGVVLAYLLSTGPVLWAVNQGWLSDEWTDRLYAPLEHVDERTGELLYVYQNLWLGQPHNFICGGIQIPEGQPLVATNAPPECPQSSEPTNAPK
jgi:hypothetical protein